MMMPSRHYTLTPDWVQYLECAIAVVPEVLLIVFAARITEWFRIKSGKTVSRNIFRIIGLAGLLVVGLAAWTVHLHSPECVGCGGR